MKRIYLHPMPVRIWHWLHAFGIAFLVLSGIQIRFADYILVVPLKKAVELHNLVGLIVAIDYLLWFTFYVFTGRIRTYFPTAEELILGSMRQAIYYGYGIFRGDPSPFHPTPENKFNPMQKMAYLFIMLFFIPIQILTGFLLWNIKGYREIIDFMGGVKIVDTIHVLLFFFFFAFIIAHAYLATLGHTPWAHFKAMITGWEEEPEEEHS